MTTPATASDWRTRARNLAIRGEAWIEGRYVPAASGATFECLSPIDGRLIARVAATDAIDVDHAVAAARRAFEDGRWARQPPASAQEGAAQVRGVAAREPRRARAARNTRHGQADLRQSRGRHPGHGALHRLVRGGDRQDLRRDRTDEPGCACDGHPRARRRRRGDRAVEFPAHHGGLEDRTSARGRKLGHPEAV